MPRGPRRYLRPVAESMSQPMRSTSIGSWPTDWQASRRYGTPASRVSGPDLLGRVDEPPWVGTWVMATSRTGPAAVVESAAEVLEGELSGLVVVDDLDDRASSGGDLQEGDHVAGVLGPRR